MPQTRDHLEVWRPPVQSDIVPCVSCGGVVGTFGHGLVVPSFRGFPVRLRIEGKRSYPSEQHSQLLVCPNCKELHEVRLSFKEAA